MLINSQLLNHYESYPHLTNALKTNKQEIGDLLIDIQGFDWHERCTSLAENIAHFTARIRISICTGSEISIASFPYYRISLEICVLCAMLSYADLNARYLVYFLKSISFIFALQTAADIDPVIIIVFRAKDMKDIVKLMNLKHTNAITIYQSKISPRFNLHFTPVINTID